MTTLTGKLSLGIPFLVKVKSFNSRFDLIFESCSTVYTCNKTFTTWHTFMYFLDQVGTKYVVFIKKKKEKNLVSRRLRIFIWD